MQLFSAIIVAYEMVNLEMKPVSATHVFTRFICGLVMHIYLKADMHQGFKNMKYALNHPWKFERPILAFFVGWMQIFVTFAIELINYVLVVGSETHMEIVLGFLALVFVSNFSSFFFQPYADAEFKKLVTGLADKYENFLRVQLKTTPRYAIYRTQK